MLFQTAPTATIDLRLVIGIGFSIFAVSCVLLFIAIRMMNEEKDRRTGMTKPEKPASSGQSGPTTMQKIAQWLQGAAKVAAAATTKAATSAANMATQAASSVNLRSNPTDAHEAMRLLRDNLTGRLIIEIAGKRYARLADIQDPNISEAVLTTVRDLNRITSGQTPLPPAAPETEISNEA